MKSWTRQPSKISLTSRTSINSSVDLGPHHGTSGFSISPELCEHKDVCQNYSPVFRPIEDYYPDEEDEVVPPLWDSKRFSKNKGEPHLQSVNRSQSYGGRGYYRPCRPKLYRLIRAASEGCNNPRTDAEKWEELEAKGRRRSDTIINTFVEEEKYQESGYGSLDRHLSRNHSNASKNGESQRPVARRSAVVASLPDSNLSVLSDTIANLQRNQPVPAHFKRSKWNFPRLHFMGKDKDRSREQKLEEVLEAFKPRKTDRILEAKLEELKDCKGDGRLAKRPTSGSPQMQRNNTINNRERKRHNAVWELFSSERTYLLDHLLVLQQVFMEPLQDLQCEGFLLSVDVRSLFGNLEELCKVSLEFCHTLLNVVGDKSSTQFGSADAINTAFETFGSTMCPPYQRYFSGYRNSLSDRDDLKSNEEYILFLEWCERNPRCQRLKLNDLLVTPMQRLTKFPLLIRSIAKYTDDANQTKIIQGTLDAVQESLKQLEGKVTWLTHFQFLQDLQGSITWPPVYEIDGKTLLPESLRHALTLQPCRNLIANPKRQLILEGSLAVVEHGKASEVYAFLFDDLLLLTKPKKNKRKPSEVPSGLKQHSLLKDGTLLTVYRQPIALDRFMLYDVESDQASSMGLKKAFVLVQENRFQQMCFLTMLQANTEETKSSWLSHLASTAAQWMEKNIYSDDNIVNSPVVKTPLNKALSTTAIDNVQRKPALHKLRSERYVLGSEPSSSVQNSNHLNGLSSNSSTTSSASELKDIDSESEEDDYL